MKTENIKKIALAMAISTTVLLQANKVSLADSTAPASVESNVKSNKENPKNVKEAEVNYNKAKEEYDKANENLKDSQKANDQASKDEQSLQNGKEETAKSLEATDKKLETAVEDNTKIQEKNVEDTKTDLSNKEKDLENTKVLTEKSEKNVSEKAQAENTAKSNLDLEKEKNPDAEEKINKANENLKASEENKTKAENDYKEKTNALEEKNKELEELNNFKAENKLLKNRVENNDSTISVLEKNKAKEESTLNSLNSDAKTIKDQLNSRQKELEDLQKQAKNSVTEKQKSEAIKQWKEGSIGFFRQNGSQQAIDVFKKLPNASKNKWNSKIYLDANKDYHENDSRDLYNMLDSLEALKKVNAKRQSAKGYKGRKLNVLRVSDYDMAVAQANANYTRVILEKYNFDDSKLNYNEVHAKIHPLNENLTWGAWAYDPDRSIEFWWDEEKAYFDKYKNEVNTNINDLDKKVREKLGNSYTIWHYAQMADLGYFFKGQNPTKSAGYAIGQGVASSVFNKQANQKTYSIGEYENRLKTYINNLEKKIKAETIQDKNLLQKIKNVQSTIDDLKNKLSAKEAEIANVKSNIADLNGQIDPLVKENTENKKVLKANQKRLENLDKEREDLKNQIDQKTKEKEASQENLNSSKAKYQKAKEDLESVNAEFKPYLSELAVFNQAQKDLTEAKNELEENINNSKKLEIEIASTKEKLEKAKELLEKSHLVDLNDSKSYEEFDYIKNLLADKEKYEKELLSLEDKLKDAKEKTLSSSKDLEEAKAVYAKALEKYIDAKEIFEKFKKEDEAKYVVLKRPSKAGYKFLYWRYGNKIYYPGQKLKLDKNIKLEAVWKELKSTRVANKVDKSYSENPNTSVNASLAPMLIGLMSTFATALLKKKEK